MDTMDTSRLPRAELPAHLTDLLCPSLGHDIPHPRATNAWNRHAADAIMGGRWLGAWLTVTAAIANSGSFLSEMSVTSQTLIGMAERGLLPRRLKEESVHGTYPWALGTIALIIALSQPLNFHALVLVCKCVRLDAFASRRGDGVRRWLPGGMNHVSSHVEVM